MAQCEILLPFILRWEGGFVNDPNDRGGATNKGVTLSTWRNVGYDKDGDGNIDVTDLKQLTDEDVMRRVLKPHYWDRWRADEITSQSIANMLVDWVWCSGAYGIKIPQRILSLKIDGIVGAKTLSAVNSRDPRELYDELRNEREEFLRRIVKNNPTQKKFLRGWINRINAIRYI